MRGERCAIAIVGSGPAGIAVARRLSGTGRPILLIEAGGERQNAADEAQVLRATRLSPATHPAAHLYRRRMLGGCSSVWGGRCLPFEASDFAPHVHRPGWPITQDEIAPYLSEATTFLEAGAPVFDETAFAAPLTWGRQHDGIDFDQIERWSPPTNVWTRYREQLEAAPSVEILPNTVVREVLLTDDGTRVRGLEVVDAASGAAREVAADGVVLACGGIETPRLMLASRTVRPNGLGNDRDLVGRHYMTHVIGDIGTLTFAPDLPAEKLGYRLTTDGVYARSIMRLTAEVRAAEDLPNVLWRPNTPPIWDPSHRSAVLSAMHFARHLIPVEYTMRLDTQGRRGAPPRNPPAQMVRHALNLAGDANGLLRFVRVWRRTHAECKRRFPAVFLPALDRSYPLELNAEQFGDPESRITLAAERDRHGMPFITVDWRPGAGTIDGIARSLELLRDRVAAAGIGTLTYDPSDIAVSLAPQGGHHIGTTRMAASPDAGVVSPEAAVFGIDNLYIAGPSVFPSASSVNPTLMAVALAFRLADHIAARAAG